MCDIWQEGVSSLPGAREVPIGGPDTRQHPQDLDLFAVLAFFLSPLQLISHRFLPHGRFGDLYRMCLFSRSLH